MKFKKTLIKPWQKFTGFISVFIFIFFAWIINLSPKSISDVNPIQNQYAFVVSPSSHISGKTFNSGITTVTTTQPHGLVAGNRFQLNDASNVNQGTFIVKTKVNVN